MAEGRRGREGQGQPQILRRVGAAHADAGGPRAGFLGSSRCIVGEWPSRLTKLDQGLGKQLLSLLFLPP